MSLEAITKCVTLRFNVFIRQTVVPHVKSKHFLNAKHEKFFSRKKNNPSNPNFDFIQICKTYRLRQKGSIVQRRYSQFQSAINYIRLLTIAKYQSCNRIFSNLQMIPGRKLQILLKKTLGNPNVRNGSAYLTLKKTLRPMEAAENFMLSELCGPH